MKARSILLVPLLLVACGRPASEPPGAAEFSVEARALTECMSPRPRDPALTYATPDRLWAGIRRIELLRSPSDPSPVVLLDSVPSTQADLVAGTRLGRVDLSVIPAGSYTHLRLRLDRAVMGLEATAHHVGLRVQGEFEIDYALSDHASGGALRHQGDLIATFRGAGAMLSQAGHLEIPAGLLHGPLPNMQVSTASGGYALTFTAPGAPIVLAHGSPTSITACASFLIHDAIGWRERSSPGFAEGVLDLTESATTSEAPERVIIEGISLEVCEGAACHCGVPSCASADAGAGASNADAAGASADAVTDAVTDASESDGGASVGDAGAADAYTSADVPVSPADSGSVTADGAPPPADAAPSAPDGGAARDGGTNLACADLDLGDLLFFSFITAGSGNDLAGSCGGAGGEEIALGWTAPASGSYLVSTAGSDFDTVLYARLPDCRGREVACNDDVDPNTVSSAIVLDVTAGETVVLVADAYGSGGLLMLQIFSL